MAHRARAAGRASAHPSRCPWRRAGPSACSRSAGRAKPGLMRQHLTCIQAQDPVGPGNAAFVEMEFEHITEVFSAVGEVSKSAELVGREVSDEAREYTAQQKPVGQY